MTPLKLDMIIPFGADGTVRFGADIPDLGALSSEQRRVLADTVREFCEFGAAAIAPPLAMAGAAGVLAGPEATVHDPDMAVLDGVRGSRHGEEP